MNFILELLREVANSVVCKETAIQLVFLADYFLRRIKSSRISFPTPSELISAGMVCLNNNKKKR